MKIYEIEISREALDKMPVAERTFLLAAAHALNEINTLIKFFRWADPTADGAGNDPHGVQARGQLVMSLVTMRLLVGKLHEAYELIRKGYLANQLSKTFNAKLDADAMASLDALNKFFGKKNYLTDVRNVFSFHYTPDQYREQFAKVPQELELAVLAAYDGLNTLFEFGEAITTYTVMSYLEAATQEEAISKLREQSLYVHAHLNRFLQAVVSEMVATYVGATLNELPHKIHEFNAPSSLSISIPFFVELADELAREAAASQEAGSETHG